MYVPFDDVDSAVVWVQPTCVANQDRDLVTERQCLLGACSAHSSGSTEDENMHGLLFPSKTVALHDEGPGHWIVRQDERCVCLPELCG